MSSSALPVSAALTARLVYVQSCPDCREVAHRFAAGCVADASIASCQLIASKKNHCCESGDALVRSAPIAPAQSGQLGFAQPPEPVDWLEENRKTREEMLRRGMIEPGQCQHGITLECCNQCSPEPASDTTARSENTTCQGGSTYDAGRGSAATGTAENPLCRICGSFTVRSGSCFTCPVCGESTGCG